MIWKGVIRLCATLYNDGLNMRRDSTRCSVIRSKSAIHQTRYISLWTLLVISVNTRILPWSIFEFYIPLEVIFGADISTLQISPYPLTLEGGSTETRRRQPPSMLIYASLSYWPIAAVRHSSNKSIKSTHRVSARLCSETSHCSYLYDFSYSGAKFMFVRIGKLESNTAWSV